MPSLDEEAADTVANLIYRKKHHTGMQPDAEVADDTERGPNV